MKRRILILAMIACFVFALTACGSKPAGNDASDTPVSSNEVGSNLPSLEEYFNSDIMQGVVSAVKEQYTEEGISADLYAEGDELHYEFRMDDVVTSEEERPAIAEQLKSSTEASAESYYDTAVQAKKSVCNDVVIVVVSFYDGDGNELYTQSFSSADAQ